MNNFDLKKYLAEGRLLKENLDEEEKNYVIDILLAKQKEYKDDFDEYGEEEDEDGIKLIDQIISKLK